MLNRFKQLAIPVSILICLVGITLVATRVDWSDNKPAPIEIEDQGVVWTNTVNPHTYARCRVTSLESPGYAWTVTPAPAMLDVVDDGKQLFFIGLPGDYTVTLGIVKDGKPALRTKLIRLLPDETPDPQPDPRPDPKPDPRPDPKPDPQPDPIKAEKAWLVFVEESSQRSAAAAQVLGDPVFLNSLKGLGVVSWEILDKDKSRAKSSGYLDAITKRGVKLPAYLLIEDSVNLQSKILAVGPVTSRADLEQTIKGVIKK